ncbi:uncharacterized protein V1516DRAFT_671856 [Lipomyces oligophaga]|uniref:uncharacterized protein n=1 Tax=Lipomyces oligophaga TaxID=45792 RepID=UPI0034CF6FEB
MGNSGDAVGDVQGGNNEVHLNLCLKYQQTIVSELLEEDALVVIAPGLGLIRIAASFIHACNASGPGLIILMNAEPLDLELLGSAIAELSASNRTLGLGGRSSDPGIGLTIVNTESITIDEREKKYSSGIGSYAVTTRILVVDMLSGIMPIEKITGIVVFHAERVTATSNESFVLRMFREKNKAGFIKAFSDKPDQFTTGLSPLATILKASFLKKASIWPRFQVLVAESLEPPQRPGHKRVKDVVEIKIALTPIMKDIQVAILECLEYCVRDLRRGLKTVSGITNRGLDLDDNDMWTVESALQESFIRRMHYHTDPVAYNLRATTRRSLKDVALLRNLLASLYNKDCISFLQSLDTILENNAPSANFAGSQWLVTDAADVLYSRGKERVYSGKIQKLQTNTGLVPEFMSGCPPGITPIFEEQPKWKQLGDILDEVTLEAAANPADSNPGATLIMCQSDKTVYQIQNYLMARGRAKNRSNDPEIQSIFSDADSASALLSPSEEAQIMLRHKFLEYISWKHDSVKRNQERQRSTQRNQVPVARGRAAPPSGNSTVDFRGRVPPPNKRRRVRGGSIVASTSSRDNSAAPATIEGDDDGFGNFTTYQTTIDVENSDDKNAGGEDGGADVNAEGDVQEIYQEDEEFGLLEMNDVIDIRSYNEDADDELLDQLRPKVIIMYEPDASFVRRIEVYRATVRADRAGYSEVDDVKVYFMYYGDSVEEQQYLSTVRKEKDAFSKIIRERGNMAMTMSTAIDELATPEEKFLRTVNTRIAGGGRLEVRSSPPRIIVDMREIRSSLPSLLHGRGIELIPAQLLVGDYILSPDICVERKSIPDLIQSFPSGRLFGQVEAMTKYYKTVILLIEFDSSVDFDKIKSSASGVGGGSKSAKKDSGVSLDSALSQDVSRANDVHANLVLLVLAFPNLRIIWSPSPSYTVSMFLDLKHNHEEPDALSAINIGTETSSDPSRLPQEQLINQSAKDMLMAIPGVTAVNYRSLLQDFDNFDQLCSLSLDQIAKSVGMEAASKIYRFLNQDYRKQSDTVE